MEKNVLLIGIGQTGCTVCELFANKMNKNGLQATAIAVDTDERTLSGICVSRAIPMIDGGALSSVVEILGSENVRKWFPCDYGDDYTEFAKTLRMDCGANQWRMKAYLSFASFLAKPQSVERFHASLDEAADMLLEGETLDIYTVASLAGGTGSGLFLPISLYVKDYFENKGVSLGQRRAVLVMPDIYENCYSAEQRVKSYANAYAALREYNAVLNCACASEKAEKGEACKPISFRIGEEGCVPQLLFDAEKSEYRTPSVAPFERIYLFERVPGTVSILAHANMIADLMVSWRKLGDSVNGNEGEKLKSDAVFAGFSALYVQYPVECTVSYIAKKQLKDLLCQETICIHRMAVAELKRRRGEAKLYGREFVETVERYADALVERTDAVFEESGTALSLIGRNPNEFTNDTSGDGIFYSEYLSDISAWIKKTIACNALDQLELMIAPPAKVPDGKDGEKRPRKKSAKEKRSELMQQARECGVLLTEVYRNGLRATVDAKDSLVKLLLSKEANDGSFSLVDKLLKQNGRYLHPAYALMRLCIVRKELGRICSGIVYFAADEPASNKAKLSEDMLQIRDFSRGMTKYSKAGENRFQTLIFDEDEKHSKLADDKPAFILDLTDVLERLIQRLNGFCYMILLETMDDLISKYKEFVSVLEGLSDELAADERLALMHKSEANGVVINVGTSCAEKIGAYEEYKKQYCKNPSVVGEYTACLGESVCEAVLGKNGDESMRGAVLKTLDRVEAKFASQCENSEFYRTTLDKNILQAILESSERRDSGITLSRVFHGRPASLHITLPDKHSEYRDVNTRIVAIMDKEIENYLMDETALRQGKAPKAYVESLMYSAGEYSGQAEFVERMGKRNMELRCETSSLRLHLVETVNERVDGECYRYYRKANKSKVRFVTEMWNPHLLFDRESISLLPYIDPNQQKKYESDVCRAILQATANDELCVEVLDGERVYVRRVGVVTEPLFLQNNAVKEDAITDLFVWAYSRPEWVEFYKERFCELKTHEEINLAAIGGDEAGIRRIRIALHRSEVLNIIGSYALPLLAKLLTLESTENYGFASTLAELSGTVIEELCKKACSDTNGYYVTLYNRCVNQVAKVLEERVGSDVVKNLFSWAAPCGYFGYYNEMGVRVVYSFERLAQWKIQNGADVTQTENLSSEDEEETVFWWNEDNVETSKM